MFKRFASAILIASLTVPAHADILVGSYDNPSGLRAFTDNANGNAAPVRVIAGPTSGLVSAAGGAYDAVDGVVLLADFWGQAIRVFPMYANGNVAPVRVLDSPQLGQMRTVALDMEHDELITTHSGCCLAVYNRTASGSDYALRTWAWGGGSGSQTQLNNPGGYAYAPARDEILVSESDANGAKILVFDRIPVDGYAPPKRVIRGSLTGLGVYAAGIAVDAANDLLYVAAYATNPDSSHSGRVLVFAANAGGNVAPLRMIAGSSTQLETSSSGYPAGVTIDTDKQRLIVSVTDYSAQAGNALLIFPLNANGNVAPVQAIRGAATGLSNVGQPIWVPAKSIFANGFE